LHESAGASNVKKWCKIPDIHTLPDPPRDLAHGDVTLELARIVAGNRRKGLVPYYHFRVLLADGTDAGHINFRVGDTEHVRIFAGHIGFAIGERFRGNGYAYQACRAIAPFVATLYERVTITCDPDNISSIHTIERLGARYIDTVDIPPGDPAYKQGARVKQRYHWILGSDN